VGAGGNGRHISEIRQQIKLWRYSPVDAEEPVVNDGGDGQRVKGEDARFVDPGGIFVQALASGVGSVSEARGMEKDSNAHSRLKVKYSVKCLHSWFPLSRASLLGYHSLRVYKYKMHCPPRVLNYLCVAG
jgi:hypothetical protein